MTRWDQRAVALVALRGTAADRGLFEARLEAPDWEVLEKDGPPVTSTTEGPCAYMVEVRFPGSFYRAVTGARERLEVVADDLGLDVTVEAVELVDRDPADLPVWYAYEPPPLRPCTTPVPPWERARERVVDWWTVTFGRRDTGRQVRALSEAHARALAGRSLPGTPPAPPGVRVRRIMGGRPRPAAGPPARRRGPMRQLGLLRFPALLALVFGAWIGALRDLGVAAWWPALPFLALALAGAAVVLRRAAPTLSAGGAVCAALVLVAGAGGIGVNSVTSAPDEGLGLRVMVIGVGFGYLLGTGVWLLVRQSSWRGALPWLLPATLPLAPLLLPALGLSLPAAYLDAFGLDLEDVEVPAVWRLIAALKFVAALALWLIAPGLVGYAKHLHHLVRDRWMGYAVGLVLFVYCLLQGMWALALEPAAAAGGRAVATAAEGGTPPSYYGIKPEWMCVRPVTDPEKVPVEGGLLDPGAVYLLMGDSGGTAVLWDAKGKAALKVPLASLRLVPADDPRRPCP